LLTPQVQKQEKKKTAFGSVGTVLLGILLVVAGLFFRFESASLAFAMCNHFHTAQLINLFVFNVLVQSVILDET
jgi:hypothetical protein